MEERPAGIPECPKSMDRKEERPAGIPECPKSMDRKEERPAGIPECPKSMDRKEENIMGNRIPVHMNGTIIYEIVMETGFDKLKEELIKLNLEERKVCIVTDSNVAPPLP